MKNNGARETGCTRLVDLDTSSGIVDGTLQSYCIDNRTTSSISFGSRCSKGRNSEGADEGQGQDQGRDFSKLLHENAPFEFFMF